MRGGRLQLPARLLRGFCARAQERLGVLLEKADEMECAVAGCNFLLRAILHEAFTFEAGQAQFVSSNGAPPDSQTSGFACKRQVHSGHISI